MESQTKTETEINKLVLTVKCRISVTFRYMNTVKGTVCSAFTIEPDLSPHHQSKRSDLKRKQFFRVQNDKSLMHLNMQSWL